MFVLIAIGFLIDYLTWKYRHVGKLIFPYEMVQLILQTLVPFDYGNFENLLLLFLTVFMFLLYSTNPKRDIPCSIVALLMSEFICFPQVFTDQSFTVSLIIAKLLNVVATVTVLTIFSMLVTHVAQIRGKIGTLMFENLNLLDGMHEGLLVLSAVDNESL